MSGPGGGLTDRAALVPISVEALVVGRAPVRAVSLAPRLDLFAAGRRLGGELRAAPWDDRAIVLEPGVHLHWKLPAALTHGVQSAGGVVEFPPVPNRWLVLRVAADDAPAGWTRAWVVQSDAMGSDARNATIVRDPGGAYLATRIGRADLYDAYRENPPAAEPLTAIGAGDPMFAAFYPGCRDVFGFHDVLQGIDEGTFLYLVAGWYARREDDPLGSDGGRTEHVERREDLEAQWFSPAVAEASPTRTVCHGTLHGVAWRRGDDGSAAMPGGATYRVAVGNTAVEALSALVAAPAERGHLWEPLLSGFQYGVLANLDLRRGMPDLDAELHRRRFHAIDGGTEWIMRPTGDAPPGAPASAGAAIPAFPTDSVIARLFEDLVEAQRVRDRLDRELLSVRADLHAVWYRAEQHGTPGGRRVAAARATLEQAVRSVRNDLYTTDTAIRTLRAELGARGIRIRDGAGEAPGSQRHELVAMPMPWFWRANEPAILCGGPGDPGAHRYEGGGRGRTVACRLVEDVVSGLATPSGQGLPAPARRLPLERRAASTMPLDEIEALVRESLLLDPARLRALGDNAAGARIVGTTPADALASWAPAWHPLFVVWEVEWAPDYAGDVPPDVTRRWDLGDNTEYRRRQEAIGEPARVYRGWAPLSLSLARQLQDQLKAAPGEVSSPFAAWTLLTQSAAGLNDGLIMREETVQLPPLRGDGTVDAHSLHLFGAAALWSPLAPDPMNREGFFPVRSGHARITRLQLVDGFGRPRTVVGDEGEADRRVITADAMTGLDGRPTPWIALPPRIVQPARLLARWMSARPGEPGRSRESTSNPATSPILGWMVPGHRWLAPGRVDGSLFVYDAGGRLRGELQTGAEGPVWVVVAGPGDAERPDAALADSPHLQALVEGLVRGGPAALAGLLELIDRVGLCITTPVAHPVHGPAHVVGQPLVLARASLTLEVYGRRATDQRVVDPAGARTGGIGGVQFPVRVGDVGKSTDGVIGCFVGSDYTRFRPAFAALRTPDAAPAPRAPDAYFAIDDELTVSLDAGPVDLTLLLDPRGVVHVASGILPVARLELPGPLVADALDRMEPAMHVGPVLGAADDFRLPVPDDIHGSWTWMHRERPPAPPWHVDADVDKPATAPGIPSRSMQIREGWLAFKRADGAAV